MKSEQLQRGITMVEVLVSIIVLSIGLLGIAGLQANVTKYKINSWSRAAVSVLLADISDRIRINSDLAGASFIVGTPYIADSVYIISDTWANQIAIEPTAPAVNCLTQVCSNSDLANYDLASWRILARKNLPLGSALLVGNKAMGFTATLMWFDKEFTDKGKSETSALLKASTCSGTEQGLAQQTCCPEIAKHSAGVRCANFQFLP